MPRCAPRATSRCDSRTEPEAQGRARRRRRRRVFGEEPARYRGLVDSLLWGGDHYLLLADFDDYVATQGRVDALYRDRDAWARKAIANVAGMGLFSSDRTILEYAREVWHITPQR